MTRQICDPNSVLHMLDHPNERSLHTRPVPRTGGVAILAGIALACLAWGMVAEIPATLAWIAAGAVLVALVSFMDDRFGLSVRWRLLGQLVGCQKRHWMEQMVCLALIAFAIGLVLGETLRSHIFPDNSRKRKLYSGLFILLKLKLTVDFLEFRQSTKLHLKPSEPSLFLSELLSELRPVDVLPKWVIFQ